MTGTSPPVFGPFCRGFDWQMVVTLVDPATGLPQTIPADATVTGQLWLRGGLQPAAVLTAANGGLASLDRAGGRAAFFAGSALTAQAAADPDLVAYGRATTPPFAPLEIRYQTRLLVAITRLGATVPVTLAGIRVGDARSLDPEYFRTAQELQVVAAVTHIDGVFQTINGKSGLVVNLDATDVGAYSEAEVDARLAALAAAVPTIPLDAARYKRALNAWRPGSVESLYQYCASGGEGDDDILAFRSTYAGTGGPFEGLLRRFLLAAPADGGLGLAAADVTMSLAALRVAAAALPL